MIPYIIALLLSVGICWITASPKLHIKISFPVRVLLVALPLFIISAFRYNIGTDYQNYVEIMEHLKAGDYRQFYGDKLLEPLYLLLNYVLILFRADPQWLFIITSAAYTALMVYVILRYSSNSCLSLFLLFGSTAFFEQMNTMRGHLAYAVLLLALVNLLEGKNRKFLIYCLVASLLHISALPFAALILLKKVNLSPKVVVIVVAACFIFCKPLIKLAEWFIRITPYGFYLDRLEAGGSGIWGILIQLAIFALMTVFYKKDDKAFQVLYLLEALNLILTLFMGSIPLIGRLRWIFYYPVVLFAVPMTLENIKNNYIKWTCVLGCISGFTVYTYIMIVARLGQGVFPYQWIF